MSKKIKPDELARFERIINPGSLYLARVRAEEIYAVSIGDLESAEHYHQLHSQAVAGLRRLAQEWSETKRFPQALRAVRQLLENYV